MLTAYELRRAAFSDNLTEVEDLALTNKGILDLNNISSVPNVSSLNLAFNSLASLSALSSLTRLQNLNVSHNNLVSLKSISQLPSLTVLNASHNKLSSISGVSACTGLRELWIQHNAVKSPEELHALSTLTCLERMCLAPNPLVKALPADVYRPLLVALCPSLKVLDATPVTAEDSAAAATMLGSADGQGIDIARLMMQHRPGSGGKGVPGGAGAGAPACPGPQHQFVQRRSAPASPATSTTSTSQRSGLPAGIGGRQPRPYQRAVLPRAARPPVATPSSGTGLTPTATSRLPLDPGPCDPADPVALPPDDGDTCSLASGSSLASMSLSTGSRTGITGRRTRAAAAHIPRIKEIPTESKFQAVLATLPVFEAAKLPVQYTPFKVAEMIPKKPQPVQPPPEAQTTAYELRYPQGSAQARAVTVRADGSVSALWPNGDLAVTVDAQYGTVDASPVGSPGAGDAGETAAAAPAEPNAPTYRMYATYRQTGNVAASWDASGGFVQYSNGSIAIIYNTASGSGTHFSPSGDVCRKWSDGAADVDGPASVDVQLDAHLAARYSLTDRSLQLYLACEGVQYCFVCGRNKPGSTWTAAGEPPQGGLGSTGRLQGAGAGEAGGEITGAGDAAVTAASSASSASPLPPPSFLQQLADQGSSNSKRSSRRQQQQQQPDRQQAQVSSFASITSALKDLDDGLSSWLTRRASGTGAS